MGARVDAYSGSLPPAAAPLVVDTRVDLEPEARLVDAAIAGDTDAFAALYDRHAARVYRHCYYLVVNRVEAEDLMQQTFLAAWKAIRRYRRGTAPFVAWLLTIAEHVAIDHLRRRHEVAPLETMLEHPDAEADPAKAVAAILTRDTVRQAILHLRPERRQVIILRFIEGFSISEIASLLGKTENHTSVIQHRALQEMRRFLLADGRLPADKTLMQRFSAAVTAVLGHMRQLDPLADR